MARVILMVDDDEGFLLAASHLLKAEDYEVVTARSADEARSQLESGTPDLILLDVIMPGKDGFTFAAELSKDEKLAAVPVVLVTAVADSPGQMIVSGERKLSMMFSPIPKASRMPAASTCPSILTTGLMSRMYPEVCRSCVNQVSG